MANWTEFHIRIDGRRTDQRKVIALLEAHQRDFQDTQTPWLFEFADLVHEYDDQIWFLSPDKWHEWRGDLLVIWGEMNWAPPLLIVAELAKLFPRLTFDVISTTEHERLEHW